MSLGINTNIGTNAAAISDNNGAVGTFNGHTITRAEGSVVSSLDQNSDMSIMPSIKTLTERHVSIVHPQENLQSTYASNPDSRNE
ncbi:MAG: hypothetical protein MJ218_00405 [Opitutales bacterium]|nr:hypothetical protein [Opitutales bacterium]